MIGLSIAGAVERGVKLYDLLRGAEPYKFDWANETRATFAVQVAAGRPILAITPEGALANFLRRIASDSAYFYYRSYSARNAAALWFIPTRMRARIQRGAC